MSRRILATLGACALAAALSVPAGVKTLVYCSEGRPRNSAR